MLLYEFLGRGSNSRYHQREVTLVNRKDCSDNHLVRVQLQQPCALDTVVKAKVNARDGTRLELTKQLSRNARKGKNTQRVNSVELSWDGERMQSLKPGKGLGEAFFNI